jgi:hypothetical protein
MPNYMTQPLTWTLNQVLGDLEIANVTFLYLPNNHQQVSPSPNDNIRTYLHLQPSTSTKNVSFVATNTLILGMPQNNALLRIHPSYKTNS